MDPYDTPLVKYIIDYEGLLEMWVGLDTEMHTTIDEMLDTFYEFDNPKLYHLMMCSYDITLKYRMFFLTVYHLFQDRKLGQLDKELAVERAKSIIRLFCIDNHN